MTLWIIIAAIIAALIVSAAGRSSNKESAAAEKLKKSWGKLQKKKYAGDDYENISHYYKRLCGNGYHVDDITWNDLEFDRIFQAMDITGSSIGRENLYKTLRMPSTEKETLNGFDESVKWISTNEKRRIRMQLMLQRLGFVKDFSFSDYIDTISELKSVGSKISIILDVILAASIFFTIFVNAAVGIVIIIATALTATGVYFKKKPEIEPYFTCLSQVSRMVRTGQDLCKDTDLINSVPVRLKSHLNTIQTNIKNLEPCIKGDWLIADSRGTGSPGEVFMNYIRMFTHVDIIHYNRAVYRMKEKEKDIMQLMESLGEIETMICTASFREAVSVWCVPELSLPSDEFYDGQLVLDGVIHPLIEGAVPNSVAADSKSGKNILITGSNASGKSTFLKAVAINAILSQAIMTSLAGYYNAPFYRIYSSMSLRDDLAAGGSYYMVEIKSLKRILDASKDKNAKIPVLCFVDEVLRGTNTIERIAASSAILKNLKKNEAMTFAATHDIELTSILSDYYSNYHFREEMTDEGIRFSYKLFDGPATTRNAIALLENLGYDKDITDEARQRADLFSDSGLWK